METREKIKKILQKYRYTDLSTEDAIDSILLLLDVVGRSEQLKSFAEFCQDNYSFEIPDRIIKDYEQSL
jgi:predicted RNase H-like nuclease